jgi:lipopolysaccharide/colanic/teichoic acid biosynthesis glycosyltransferase
MYALSKRLMDIVLASLALIALAPFLPLIAICIKLDSSGPVLFRQKRLGKGGKSFTMYKFRTMQHNAPAVRNADGSYFVGDKDPRLTRVGQFLRTYTFDEIPQLLNVLRGDMSVVGPRPDPVEVLEIYDDLLKRKLEVKPGMASLALVYGRNALPWRKRVELEVYYIDHRSLKFDLEIFLKGVALLVLHKGVYSPQVSQGITDTNLQE